MNYLDGFSFLTYSRKKQLIRLLSESGCLPIYYDGQEEMYLKAGRRANGEMLLALLNLGFDATEEIVLCTDEEINEVRYLTLDGALEKVEFRKEGNKLIVDKELFPLTPVILVLNA